MIFCYPALSCVRLWPLHAGDEGFAIATGSLASIERGQYQHHGEPWCESAELGSNQPDIGSMMHLEA